MTSTTRPTPMPLETARRLVAADKTRRERARQRRVARLREAKAIVAAATK